MDFSDIEDLVVPFDTISFNGKTYQVRGLTGPHIIWLVRNYGQDLAPLYSEAAAGKLPASTAAIADKLGDSFGDIAAAVIACGMGKPSAIANVQALPFPSQLEALDKIIRLTTQEHGGLGKVVEIVAGAVQALALLAQHRKT